MFCRKVVWLFVLVSVASVLLTVPISFASSHKPDGYYPGGALDKDKVDQHGGCIQDCVGNDRAKYYWWRKDDPGFRGGEAPYLTPHGTCEKDCYGAFVYSVESAPYFDEHGRRFRAGIHEIVQTHNFRSEEEAKTAAMVACKTGHVWNAWFDKKYGRIKEYSEQCVFGATFASGQCLAFRRSAVGSKGEALGYGIGNSEEALENALLYCNEKAEETNKRLGCGQKLPKYSGWPHSHRNYPISNHYSLCNK